MSFKSLIASDLIRHSGGVNVARFIRYYLFNPSFRVIFSYRLGHYCLHSHNVILRYLIYPFVYLVHWHNQLRMGIQLDFKTEVGNSLCFSHPGGIIINPSCRIGNNVTIYQNVTIGGQRGKSGCGFEIGDKSIIFAGAVIVGPVKIGKCVVIGANAVVTKDIPDYSVVGGIPAKILKTDSSAIVEYY